MVSAGACMKIQNEYSSRLTPPPLLSIPLPPLHHLSLSLLYRGPSRVDGGDHGMHVGHDSLQAHRGFLLAAAGLVPTGLGLEQHFFALMFQE